MNPALGTIIIYARDVRKTAAFYCKHFGFTAHEDGGMVELTPVSGGAGMLIHPAAKSIKLGQVGVKLSFHVQDVAAFIAEAAEKGLKFGSIHVGNGYQFANAKDPDRNNVSVSSRTFRVVATG